MYGASGFAGRLIAREAARRGLRPVIAGRDTEAIARLANELSCPARAFSLDDASMTAAHLFGIRAVLNCAGPFIATAEPMIEAC
ncbi:MAG TPA: saccharopine dehydrogenase NADP-binding domain-containing protein, partial [Pirellulales bacterium]|nr:saccharopine dehydrogenase NADP-binding domain-containing protein [Pirellulales bacterium]